MKINAVLLEELRLSGLGILEISKATGIGTRSLRSVIIDNADVSEEVADILKEFIEYSKAQILLNNPIDGFVPKKLIEIIDFLNMPGAVPKVSAATGIKTDTLYSYRSGKMRPGEDELSLLINFINARRPVVIGTSPAPVKPPVVTTPNLPQYIFPGCDMGQKINGNSMAPRVLNHAFVCGKRVEAGGFIEAGELYALSLNAQYVVRYVFPDNGKLRLEAENKAVEPVVVPIEAVEMLFRVYFVVNPA